MTRKPRPSAIRRKRRQRIETLKTCAAAGLCVVFAAPLVFILGAAAALAFPF